MALIQTDVNTESSGMKIVDDVFRLVRAFVVLLTASLNHGVENASANTLQIVRCITT